MPLPSSHSCCSAASCQWVDCTMQLWGLLCLLVVVLSVCCQPLVSRGCTPGSQVLQVFRAIAESCCNKDQLLMLHRPKKKKLSAPRVYASLTNLESIGHVVNTYSQPGRCLPLEDINPKTDRKSITPRCGRSLKIVGSMPSRR